LIFEEVEGVERVEGAEGVEKLKSCLIAEKLKNRMNNRIMRATGATTIIDVNQRFPCKRPV